MQFEVPQHLSNQNGPYPQPRSTGKAAGLLQGPPPANTSDRDADAVSLNPNLRRLRARTLVVDEIVNGNGGDGVEAEERRNLVPRTCFAREGEEDG